MLMIKKLIAIILSFVFIFFSGGSTEQIDKVENPDVVETIVSATVETGTEKQPEIVENEKEDIYIVPDEPEKEETKVELTPDKKEDVSVKETPKQETVKVETPKQEIVKSAVDTDTVSMKDIRKKEFGATVPIPEKWVALENEILANLNSADKNVLITIYQFSSTNEGEEFKNAWKNKYHYEIDCQITRSSYVNGNLFYSASGPLNFYFSPEGTRYKKQVADDIIYGEKCVEEAVKAAGIYKGMSVKEAVKKINAYVCKITAPDENYESNNDIASIFRIGKSLCNGYSQLFEAMCRYCGIDAGQVFGRTTGAHAWNSVKFSDGTVLYVDCLWNDMGYNYVLVNRNTISKTHTFS